MTTTEVYLSTDVYMVCLSHALSTEKEEVMGLLIGEIDQKKVAHVSAIIMLRRSDKRKDRVEISPEQLSAASTQAEELAQVSCRPMRVLGWYHSHPHITVWPSQLDVQTQGSYQMMDEGFVGLIFSVFNEEEQKFSRIQVTCFQSRCEDCDSNLYVRCEIPLHIVPSTYISGPCLNALAKLPRLLCQEEQSAYSSTDHVTEMDLLTKLHNCTVYSRTLCQIAEVISGPLLQVLETLLFSNQHRKRKLEEKRNQLLEFLEKLKQAAETYNAQHASTSGAHANNEEDAIKNLQSKKYQENSSQPQTEGDENESSCSKFDPDETSASVEGALESESEVSQPSTPEPLQKKMKKPPSPTCDPGNP